VFLLNHTIFLLYTKVHGDFDSIPKDVKNVIVGMFFYVLAWGIFDPFISIFIHSIVGNYSIAGVIYGLSFLIGAGFAMPVGDLADKVNKIKYSYRSILLYPVVGLLYFFAAQFSGVVALALLLAGRVLNGVLALFWIMIEGFIRLKSPKGETSATFGLYITTYKLAYVVAPLFTIPLVLFLGVGLENVHLLALALIPFPIIAAFIISRTRDGGESLKQGINDVVVKDRVFLKEIADLKKIGAPAFVCLLLGFFIKAIDSIIFFLVPLFAISLNMSLIELSILFALINIPYLFSFFFAELADSFGKANVIAVGFAASAIALMAIGLTPLLGATFYAACFALGLILAVLRPAVNGLITDITPRANDGEMTGTYTMVFRTSGFVTPIAFGLLSESFGLASPFMALSVFLLAMAVVTLIVKRKIVVNI